METIDIPYFLRNQQNLSEERKVCDHEPDENGICIKCGAPAIRGVCYWLIGWFGTFEVTKRDQKLYELAKRYHTETEYYDRTVCTGPVLNDSIMPATSHEMALINRNAMVVRKRINADADRDGFTLEEMRLEISKWNR